MFSKRDRPCLKGMTQDTHVLLWLCTCTSLCSYMSVTQHSHTRYICTHTYTTCAYSHTHYIYIFSHTPHMHAHTHYHMCTLSHTLHMVHFHTYHICTLTPNIHTPSHTPHMHFHTHHICTHTHTHHNNRQMSVWYRQVLCGSFHWLV